MDYPSSPKKFSGKRGDVSQENRALKQKIEALERENKSLKKSIYDISLRVDELRATHEAPRMRSVFSFESLADTGSTEPTRHFTLADPLLEMLDGASRGEIRRKAWSRQSMHFACSSVLSGHRGAVHSTLFSPDGRLLASASVDQTARLWPALGGAAVHTLAEHKRPLVALAWSTNSQTLATAALDGCVRWWSAIKGFCTAELNIRQHGETAHQSPLCLSRVKADPNVMLCGTTDGRVLTLDLRSPETSQSAFQNKAMVNSISYAGEHYIVSGDAAGMLRRWDRRVASTSTSKGAVNKGCVESEKCGAGHPIAHIANSGPIDASPDSQLLAVTSYDDVLRVYSREEVESTDAAPRYLRLVGSVANHKIGSWPIQCAFFVGEKYSNTLVPRDLSTALLVATGGSDGDVWLNDVASMVTRAPVDPLGTNVARTIQHMQGHTDRAYSVDFHRRLPLLASGGADCTVRLWTPLEALV